MLWFRPTRLHRSRKIGVVLAGVSCSGPQRSSIRAQRLGNQQHQQERNQKEERDVNAASWVSSRLFPLTWNHMTCRSCLATYHSLLCQRHRPHHQRDSETMACSGDSGCRRRQWCVCVHEIFAVCVLLIMPYVKWNATGLAEGAARRGQRCKRQRRRRGGVSRPGPIVINKARF